MICCLRHGRLVIVILALIAGVIGLGFYFEWSFVTQNWPFFLFLLCPLSHLLGGHGENHQNKKDENTKKKCH